MMVVTGSRAGARHEERIMLTTLLSAMARRAIATAGLWWGRRRSRAQLAWLSDHELKDIGLTPGQARFEVGLPFWRP